MDNKIWEFLAISNFEGGGEPKPPNIQELNITQNGTYEAMDGVDGYNPVTVNVSGGEPEPPGSTSPSPPTPCRDSHLREMKFPYTSSRALPTA